MPWFTRVASETKCPEIGRGVVVLPPIHMMCVEVPPKLWRSERKAALLALEAGPRLGVLGVLLEVGRIVIDRGCCLAIYAIRVDEVAWPKLKESLQCKLMDNALLFVSREVVTELLISQFTEAVLAHLECALGGPDCRTTGDVNLKLPVVMRGHNVSTKAVLRPHLLQLLAIGYMEAGEIVHRAMSANVFGNVSYV